MYGRPLLTLYTKKGDEIQSNVTRNVVIIGKHKTMRNLKKALMDVPCIFCLNGLDASIKVVIIM